MKRLSALLAAGAVAASLFATAGPAAAAAGDATVWVVHGVPGATVEVCVNGSPVKDGFTYRQKFSAMLTPGDTTFALYADGSNCTGTPLGAANITKTLAMDGNYTIVAAQSVQTGKVRFFWFSNDLSNTQRGKFRLSLRHVAVAPVLNVFMDKVRQTPDGLRQGDSRTVQLPWGDYVTRVKQVGKRLPILGPVTLSFSARTAVQLYIVGNSTVGYKFLRITQDVVKAPV